MGETAVSKTHRSRSWHSSGKDRHMQVSHVLIINSADAWGERILTLLWLSLSTISGIVVLSLSHVLFFAIPWTLAHQAPLSMRFPRQEYWSGLPFPSSRNLPNPGIKPRLLHCRQILYQLSQEDHQGEAKETQPSWERGCAGREGLCEELKLELRSEGYLKVGVSVSHSVMSDSWQTHGL